MTSLTRRSPLRSKLVLTTALAGIAAALPNVAQAQNTPSGATVVAGGATFNGGGTGNANGTPTNLNVNLGVNGNTIINWNAFDVSNGSTVNFDSALAIGVPVAVLNRVTGPTVSNIQGAITSDSNVAVWLLNPNGILIGSGGSISTGSFVGSTLAMTDADFLAGTNFTLTGAPGSTAGIAINGATITTANGNRGLVLVAPQISANGTFDAGDQDVAFITATDVTLSYGGIGGPLEVTIDAGTTVGSASQIVQGTVEGRNVYFALASQASVTDALLDIDATVTATTAAASDTGIVLSGGRNVSDAITVTANATTSGAVGIDATGDLTASGQGGDIRAIGNGAVGVVGDIDASQAVRLEGTGDVLANNIIGDGGVTVLAGGRAAIDGNVTAGNTYSVTGASVALGLDADSEIHQTTHGILITATDGSLSTGGAINGGAGLTIRTNSDGIGNDALTLTATGGDIIFNATSTLEGGTNRQSDIEIRTDLNTRVVQLGNIEARGLLAAVGAAGFSNGITRDANITLGNVDLVNTLSLTSGTGNVATGNVVVTGNNQDALLTATVGTITAGDIDADRDVTIAGGSAVGLGAITAGDDASITANGALTALSVSGDDGVTIVQGGTFATTITGAVESSGGAFTANGGGAMSIGSIDVDGNVNIGGTTQPVSLAVNGTTEAGGALTVRTATGQVYTGAVIAAGAVNLANALGGNIEVNGGLTSSGSTVDIDAVEALLGGDISGSGAVDLDGSSISVGGVTSVNDSIVMNTTTGVLVVAGDLVADNDITLTSAGSANLLGGADAGDDIAITGTSVVLGNLASNEIRADDTIVVQATAGSVSGSAGLIRSADSNAVAGDFLIISATGAIALGGTNLEAGPSQVGLKAGSGFTIATGDVTAALLGNANATNTGVNTTFNHDASSTFGDLTINAQPLAITLAAGNLVTGDILSRDTSLLAISDGQTITTGNIDASAGNVVVRAGDAAIVGDISASAAVNLQGATLSAGTVTAGAPGAVLTAVSGNLSAGEIASGGNVVVTANTGIATLADGATIAGDYTVTAAAVNLGVDPGTETQSATGAVTITALGGGIIGGDGLTLRSGTGPLTLDGQTINFAPTSTLRAGATGVESDVQIRSTTSADSVTLGDVQARSLLSAVGIDPFTNGITRDSSITVGDVTLVNTLALTSNLGDVTVGGATVTGVGQGISLFAAGNLTAPGSFAASGSISLVGSNSLTIGSLDSATGSVFVQSSAGGVTASGLLEGTSVTVRALGGDAAITGAVNAQAGNYLVTGNSVTLGTGVVQQATGLIDIISTVGGISGGAGLTLRSDVAGSGGGYLFIDSAGGVALADSTLQAGTAGTADFAVHAASGQAVTLGDITAARFGEVSTDHISFINTFEHDAAVTVGDATINAGDFSITTTAGDLSTGSVDASAVQIVTLSGAIGTGDLTATTGLLNIQGFGAVTGGVYSAATSAGVSGGSIDLTSLTATAGPLTAIANAGDLRIGTVNSGSTATLSAMEPGSGSVFIDSATSVGNLVVSSAGSISGDSGERADLISTAGSIDVDAVGVATLGMVSANQSVDIQAAEINATSIDAVNGSLILNATASGLTLGNIDGATGITLTALNDLTVAGATSSGGAISLTSTGGNTTLGTASAALGVSVSAAGAASVTGNVTASGGDYRVTGGTVSLGAGAVQQATGRIDIASTVGGITGGAGLALRSNTDGVGSIFDFVGLDSATGIAMGDTTITSGTAGARSIVAVRAGSGQAITLGDVTGGLFGEFSDAMHGGVFGAITHDADFTVGTVNANALNVDLSAGSITTGDVTVSTGLSLVAQAGAVTTDNLNSGGTIAVTAANAVTGADYSAAQQIEVLGSTVDLGAVATLGGGAVNLSATNGDLIVDTVNAVGGSALSAVGGSVRVDSVTAGGAVTVDSAGEVSGNNVARTDLTSSTAGVTVTAAGPVNLGTGQAATDFLVNASTIDATSLTANGGALVLQAGAGGITLGSGSAQSATFNTTGAATISTELNTLGNVAVFAQSAAFAPIVSTTGTVSIATFGGGYTGFGGGRADITAGAGITLNIAGNALIGTLDAGGAISATAAALDITTVDAAGTLDLEATAGDLVIDTGSSGGQMTLTAANDILFNTLDSGAGASLTAGGDILGDMLTAVGGVSTSSGGLTNIGTVDSTDIAISSAVINIDSISTPGSLSLTSTAGNLTLGTGSAGTTATLNSVADLIVTTSLTANGLASATAVGSATISAISSSGGDVVVNAASADIGNASASGLLNLSATGGALQLATGTAGGAATLTATGPLTITNSLTSTGNASATAMGALTAGQIRSTAGSVTAGGASVAIGTATAATTLAVTASAGDAAVNGSAGTTATITASRDVTVGTGLTSGGATTITAGRDARLAQVATTAGALSVTATAGQVSGATAGTRANLSAGGAGSALSVTAGDAALLGTASGTGGVTVNADTIDVTNVAASGGAIALTASVGGITVGTGSASGNATFDAIGTASLGAVTAGAAATLRVRAGDVAINGAQRAGTIELVNRTPASTTMRLGDGTAAGGFAVNNTELALLDANTLTLDGGSGAVEIGTLTFDADAGRTAVNVLSTGQIGIGGLVSGTGSGRLFRFGGDASAAGKASTIRIETTSDAGGRLMFGTSDVELRGQRIVMGLEGGFLDVILGGTPLSAEAVAGQFISNPNSALYNPAITGQFYSDQNILVANSLTVRFSDYALFQNTAPAGSNGGVVLGTAAAPAVPALTIDGSGSGGADGFALFGTINGVSGSGAALLGPNVIVINDVDLPNARVNGCLIGSGAGCLTSVVVQPVLNVFDSSRLDVLRAADDLSLPFDPVVGSNNEALFSGVSSIDPSVAGEECAANPDAPECKVEEEETAQ